MANPTVIRAFHNGKRTQAMVITVSTPQALHVYFQVYDIFSNGRTYVAYSSSYPDEASATEAFDAWVLKAKDEDEYDGTADYNARADQWNRAHATWGVWCRVSGGVTGTREAWMKENGEQWSGTQDEAEAKAAALRAKSNNHGLTAFNYRARQL